MKNLIIIMLASILSISCNNAQDTSDSASSVNNETADKAIAKTIAVEVFKNKVEAPDKALILDVRTPSEFANGHLKNAENINWLDKNFNALVEKYPKDQRILVYCQSGGRSSAAMNRLQQLGYKEVYNMQGGYSTWHSKGFPTAK